MARKFLYLVAVLTALVIAGMFALRFWAEDLTRLTFEPTVRFEAQAPVASSIYADPAMWIARPGSPGPAAWLPQGVKDGAKPLRAAVFFIHPTSYLAKAHWNAPMDDAESRERADLFVRAMASPFNASPRLWAPRYRQAAFGAFLSDAPQAKQALDLAYGDVAAAFERFVAETPASMPIVLAGHSQGAFHLKRLMAQRIAGTPLARRIVAVYAIGWPVSLVHDLPAMGMEACATPVQTGCVVSWLSYGEPAEPAMMAHAYARRPALDGRMPGGSVFLCSNPLTGMAGGSAPATANAGTVAPSADLKSGSFRPGIVPASCRPDGFLSIGPAPDMGPFVLPGNNYHVYDVPLFWMNLRADVARRIAAWHP